MTTEIQRPPGLAPRADRVRRYWGTRAIPENKRDFFNAVTTPAASGDGATVATIRLYGPIDSWGGWWGISTQDVGAVLDRLPDSVEQIVLRINSPGGEVFEAMAILNMLRAHPATVTAVVDGLAASAGSVIAAGADETVMSPGTTMMIHSPLVFDYGNAADHRKTADILDSIERSIIEVYAGKAGEKDWPALLAAETWLDSAAAVELGLVDRVAVVPDAGAAETVSDDELIVLVPEEPEDVADVLIAATATAAAHPVPPASEPGHPNRRENLVDFEELKAGLRERLGVTDADASPEALLAALELRTAEASASETPAAAIVSTLPEGARVVDAAMYEQLQADASAGRAAREQQIADRRAAVLDSAVSEGRIAPSSRAAWSASLAKDEEGVTALLAGMPKNAIPVAEIGHSDDPSSALQTADDAIYSSLYPAAPKEA